MKTMDGHSSVEHPGELLLAYVEGIVSDDDRSRLEQHIDACADCRSEVLELERTIGALKDKKEDVFCPELWELLDFLQHDEDPEGKIADHLARCPSCRQELEELKQGCEELAAPESIRNLFHEQTKQVFQPETGEPGRSVMAKLRGLIASVLPRPMLAIASAAAVALLVIFLYPESEVQPIIGLSGVNWHQQPSGLKLTPKTLRLMGPSKSTAGPEHPRPRVAVVLIFAGFEPPCPQETIDSLYSSLCPSREISKRVELLPPSEVKNSLSSIAARRSDPEFTTVSLIEKLNLSSVLSLRITAGDRGYRIDGEMISAAARQPIRKGHKDGVSDSDLPDALKDLAFALLKQACL